MGKSWGKGRSMAHRSSHRNAFLFLLSIETPVIAFQGACAILPNFYHRPTRVPMQIMTGSAEDDGLDVQDRSEAEGKDVLLASLRERLDKEGGATQFKLRTDAERAKDAAVSSAKQAASSVRDALDLDGAKSSRSSTMLDVTNWRLTVGFFRFRSRALCPECAERAFGIGRQKHYVWATGDRYIYK